MPRSPEHALKSGPCLKGRFHGIGTNDGPPSQSVRQYAVVLPDDRMAVQSLTTLRLPNLRPWSELLIYEIGLGKTIAST